MGGRFFAGFLITIPLIILLFFSPGSLRASNELTGTGGRSAALGYTTTVIDDGWGLFNNPSCLSGIKYITAGILTENRFLLKELGSRAGVLIVPLNAGTWGIGCSNFGFAGYAEWKIGLAYARNFGPSFATGLRFDYLTVHIGEGYGTSRRITFALGFKADLTDKISFGVTIDDPLPSKISPNSPKSLNTTLRIGLSYKPLVKIRMIAQADKSKNHKAALKAGIEYECLNHFYLRTGICTNPCYSTFGVGFIWKGLLFDLAASVHQQLGISPQVSIQYVIK